MTQLRRLPCLAALCVVGACASTAGQFNPDEIIALERGALDRWGKGDPQGYLGIYASDVTYFDPFAERRIDGLAAMQALYGPIAGKVSVSHYEMLAPRVQHDGNVAVLSYNLVSHARRPDGDSIAVRWNSTAVYRRASGSWKMIHSHWSFTQPELRTPIPGG